MEIIFELMVAFFLWIYKWRNGLMKLLIKVNCNSQCKNKFLWNFDDQKKSLKSQPKNIKGLISHSGEKSAASHWFYIRNSDFLVNWCIENAFFCHGECLACFTILRISALRQYVAIIWLFKDFFSVLLIPLNF